MVFVCALIKHLMACISRWIASAGMEPADADESAVTVAVLAGEVVAG
jgi:hypothetical protein